MPPLHRQRRPSAAPRARLLSWQLDADADDARWAEPRSLTRMREKLIKIGAKVIRHGRFVVFQMAEVAVPRQMFAAILTLIAWLRVPPELA